MLRHNNKTVVEKENGEKGQKAREANKLRQPYHTRCGEWVGGELVREGVGVGAGEGAGEGTGEGAAEEGAGEGAGGGRRRQIVRETNKR